ncbi:MAG: class I SAM-dependent methyltransferase [bacterium]|nr:class I SAM-dependent methyltransferase [bacterium]
MHTHSKEDNNAFVCSWREKQLLDGYRGEINSGSRVLDVGCGNGTIGKAVADAFHANVEGADVVNMLSFPLSFHALPDAWNTLRDKSFDFVMLNDALHHMEPEIQISTLRHALRVGKKVLIFDTHPTLLAKALDRMMGYLVYKGREAVPLTHKTPEAWCQCLKEMGYTPTFRVIPKPFFFYPLHHFVIVV